MNRSFKPRRFSSRLFWLFLLSAATPALILALAGYYLSVASGAVDAGQAGEAPDQQLARYYNDLLFSQLETSAELFSTTGTVDSQLCDFWFLVSDTSIGTEPVPEKAREILLATARDRARGWVDSDQRYYQYVAMPLESDTLIAGLIHNERFGDLLDRVQQRHSARSRLRALRSEYVLFLLLLFTGLSILIVIAAYFLAYRTSHKLARPLEELARAAKGIASGNFEQQVTPSGDLEMRELIESFNSMATQLDQTAAKLVQTERVAAWRQVARRFAHELKNPIQPILISLYQIEKKLAGTAQYELVSEPLRAATDELNHLTTLADRFSDLAKMPETKLEECDLGQIVHSVTQLYLEKKDGIETTVELPSAPVLVSVDRTYLREALHNIILNARDACPAGGLIKVAIKTEKLQTSLIVTDNGIGMDKLTVASARLPYFSKKAKGTGLGLAIVERSISEMNGRLAVESEPGQGTTVSLIFPLASQKESLNA